MSLEEQLASFVQYLKNLEIGEIQKKKNREKLRIKVLDILMAGI